MANTRQSELTDRQTVNTECWRAPLNSQAEHVAGNAAHLDGLCACELRLQGLHEIIIRSGLSLEQRRQHLQARLRQNRYLNLNTSTLLLPKKAGKFHNTALDPGHMTEYIRMQQLALHASFVMTRPIPNPPTT